MPIMNWEKLLTWERLCDDKIKPFDRIRSPFNTDMDRIIFSQPFRRLDKKTQVHPLKTNDNVHSRLPHSLEASSVGRSLGIALGQTLLDKNELPESLAPEHVGQILQSACLAHDIGNPPFGHAGEEVISSWFRENYSRFLIYINTEEANDLTHFEGNAQALRVLGRLEMYKNEGGLKLTYATLASMMKYPWLHGRIKKDKYNSFQNEKGLLKLIAEKTGMIKENENDNYYYKRHPMAFLSEAADDICYSIIDMEDAFELNILSYEQVENVLSPICEYPAKGDSPKDKIAHMRSLAIGKCITAVMDEFSIKYEDIMNGKIPFNHSLIENCDPKIAEPMKEAKRLGSEIIYREKSKTILEIGAYSVIGKLLEHLCTAVLEQHREKISLKSAHLLRVMGEMAPKEDDSLYQKYLKVTDYISGMTDNYATYLAKQLTGGF